MPRGCKDLDGKEQTDGSAICIEGFSVDKQSLSLIIYLVFLALKILYEL